MRTPESSPCTTITIRTPDPSIDKYPAKAHAQRVANALGRATGRIFLRGAQTAYYPRSDAPVPFRQDRDFYYLSGCNEPGCGVRYDVAADWLVLFLPRVEDYRRLFFDGRGSTVEEAVGRYDVDEARYWGGDEEEKAGDSEVWSFDDESGNSGECPHDRGTTRRQRHAELRQALDSCRAVKDEHELARIRKANAVSAAAHVAILQELPNLAREDEVEAVYTRACIAAGAHRQSYAPICGAGPHAAQLHYVDNDGTLGEAGTLLVDAGAEWDLYASDVTRTVPVNARRPGHWASVEAADVYAAVEAIQESCIERIGPGVRFIDVHWHAVHMCIDALLSLGILRGEHEDIFRAGTYLAFFPHGLGHHLGLEVHDVPPPSTHFRDRRIDSSPYDDDTTLSDPAFSGRLTAATLLAPNTPSSPPLRPGMVVTIEPGIYFNREVLDHEYLTHETHRRFIAAHVLARYMHVGGVRIEDDVLVTHDGRDNLTTAPKGEQACKVVRGGARIRNKFSLGCDGPDSSRRMRMSG